MPASSPSSGELWSIAPRTALGAGQPSSRHGCPLEPIGKPAINGPGRLSKQGNAYLRAALHMPSLSFVQHDERAKAHYEALIGRGKKKMQATVRHPAQDAHRALGLHEDGSALRQCENCSLSNPKKLDRGNRVSTCAQLGFGDLRRPRFDGRNYSAMKQKLLPK